MSILDRLFKRTKTVSAAELVTLGVNDSTTLSVLPSVQAGLFRSNTPPPKGSRELLQLYRDAPNLRMVSHKIAYNFASVRWQLYARKGKAGSGKSYINDAAYKRASFVERQAMRRKGIESGELEPIEAHPFLTLLERPNELMTGRAFRHVGQVHLDLLGETYIVFDTDNAGMPIRMWVIPPTWITELPTVAQPRYMINIDGVRVPVPVTNVVVIRDPNPMDPFGRGVGTGMALADELDVDEYAAKHLSSWFHNKGMPDMIVGLEGANQAVVERAKRAWENTLRGLTKQYRTHWTGAKLNVERLDTTFKDMALIEIRKYERDTIIQTYGVPPEKLGIITNSNRATSEASHFIFANDVLVPRLELWRSELQFKIIEKYDERLLLDYESPVPGDREFTRSMMQSFQEIFTIDEIRALADMPPLPDDKGKGFLVTRGKQYVSDLSGLSTAEIYGYHLTAGALTYNELRERLGLPSVGDWGDDRTSGIYVDPAMVGLNAAGLAPGMTPQQQMAIAALAKDDEERAKLMRFAGILLADNKVTMPTKTKTVSTATITQIINAIGTDDLANKLQPIIEALIQEWAQDTLDAIDDTIEFDPNDPAVKAHVREFVVDRVGRLINTTTRNELQVALEALGDDATKADVVAAVRGVFDRAEVERADVIAQTEALRSSQFSAKAAMSQSGIVIENEWLSTRDGRARDEHLAMDGQRRDLNEPFVVPIGRYQGARALYPGNFGIAQLDINCRCVVGAVIPADDEIVPNSDEERVRRAKARASGRIFWKGMTEGERTEVWREIDQKLQPWDARVARAASSGFRAQERAVLDAVEQLLNA